MPRALSRRDLLPGNLSVVLISTRNPLNIGAAARAMSNFGFSDLRTVNPFDLAFREAQSAVGAKDILARAHVYTTVADAVADCSLVIGTTAARNRHLEHELKLLPQAGLLIRQEMRAGKVALLFGSEKRGLSNEDFSYCHWLLRIPTVENVPAMNLGQAVALCLYELIREKQPATKARTPSRASAAEVERLGSNLIESLEVSGYFKKSTGASAYDEIRRLVRRMSLSKEDSTTVLGMLRQMLWKMRG